MPGPRGLQDQVQGMGLFHGVTPDMGGRIRTGAREVRFFVKLFLLVFCVPFFLRGVIQSNPVFWNRLIIFGALPWPNR